MLVYILLAWIGILTILLVLVLLRQPPINRELLNQNRELLNRLQAPDLKTFVALQTSSTSISDVEVISRDDESEAERLSKLTGVGDTIFVDDEDVKSYNLMDFGLSPNGDKP
jgi:hypothetical protein